MFFGTIGFGTFLIIGGSSEVWDMMNDTQEGVTSVAKVMAKHVGPIVGMLVLSNALSVIFIFLTKTFPKCMFYSLMGLTFLVYVAIIIIGFVAGSIGLSILFIILLLLNICILYCFWEYIQIGIKLIECAARFIT